MSHRYNAWSDAKLPTSPCLLGDRVRGFGAVDQPDGICIMTWRVLIGSVVEIRLTGIVDCGRGMRCFAFGESHVVLWLGTWDAFMGFTFYF